MRPQLAASAYQQRAAAIGSPVFMAIESVILGCGLVITYKAYSRNSNAARRPE